MSPEEKFEKRDQEKSSFIESSFPQIKNIEKEIKNIDSKILSTKEYQENYDISYRKQLFSNFDFSNFSFDKEHLEVAIEKWKKICSHNSNEINEYKKIIQKLEEETDPTEPGWGQGSYKEECLLDLVQYKARIEDLDWRSDQLHKLQEKAKILLEKAPSKEKKYILLYGLQPSWRTNKTQKYEEWGKYTIYAFSLSAAKRKATSFINKEKKVFQWFNRANIKYGWPTIKPHWQKWEPKQEDLFYEENTAYYTFSTQPELRYIYRVCDEDFTNNTYIKLYLYWK